MTSPEPVPPQAITDAAGDRAEAKPACEHYWASHCYDGLSVRLCQLCHEPDWGDLRRQLAAERERCPQLAERASAEYPDGDDGEVCCDAECHQIWKPFASLLRQGGEGGTDG